MRYFIFVSHGQLASGMSSALSMLVGTRDNVLHVAFQDGMDAATFRKNVEALIHPITNQDEVMVMADLISGSPLAPPWSCWPNIWTWPMYGPLGA